LVDKALGIKNKYDPNAQILDKSLEYTDKAMEGAGLKKPSKKRIQTAVNKLEAHMNGKGTKPTKLQIDVLKQAGILDSVDDLKRTAKKAVKKVTGGAKKAPSAWIQHVQKYARDNNVPYKDAMSKAKASYKK
jgi:hypothetical protein